MKNLKVALIQQKFHKSKEKTIKNTLELSIFTSSKNILEMDKTEAEDWFVVSGIGESKGTDNLGSFEVDGDMFTIYKATEAKCPRCWNTKQKMKRVHAKDVLKL